MASDELAARLQNEFPDLRVAPLQLVDVGFGSTVVETADGVIFRIARHRRAARGHGYEARLLPQLQDRLPVAVPNPQWRIEPGDVFPFGAIGYRKIPGAPLDPAAADEAIAADVARFLDALHGLRDLDARRADIQELTELQGATSGALRRLLTPAEYERVEAWWDDVEADERLPMHEPRLRHGDFWYENMLVADGRLAGVVDWGTAAYGDAAEDFATLRLIGAEFVEATLAGYPNADSDLRHRIDRHWQAREFEGVVLALELGDEAELHDAVRKLRAGPVLGAE
jgi:aminoglycoside 2''-phosphotransferase